MMGADIFRGIGYGLATAGKTVGKGFKYANENIPGGFRGAAVRILTQDPLAGRPKDEGQGPPTINVAQPKVDYGEQNPARAWTGGQASGDVSGQVYGGVNRSAVPARLWSRQPAVPVPIVAGPRQSGMDEWIRRRYAYDSRYPYPMDERWGRPPIRGGF